MTRRSIGWPAVGGSPAARLVVAPQRDRWTGERGDWAIIPDGSPSGWVVIAADREGLRRAREVVKAFVGPAVGSVLPGTSQAQFEADAGQVVFVAEVEALDSGRLQRAVERLVAVRTSSPAATSEVPVSLARKIRDFRLALSDGDARNAERQLDRLRSDGRLSGQNLNFLEIDLLGRLGRWTELRALPWFGQLTKIRRPTSVTGFMIDSIWWVDFVSASRDSPASALQKYSELSSDLYALYDAVDVPASGSARRMVALRAFHQGSEQRLERVREQGSQADRAWIDQLLRPLDPTVGLDPQDRARRMLEDGRFLEVVALAEEARGDLKILELAVRAAAEIESTELAVRVRPLLGNLVAELPETPGFVRALNRVVGLAEDDCDSWSEWLGRVAAPERWPGAADVLRENAEVWSVEGLRSGEEAVRAADALEVALGGANRVEVVQAIDLLCGLAAELANAPGASGVVDAVIYALLDETPTEALGSAFLGLVQAVLRSGPSRTRYDDLLDVCITVDQIFEARVLLPVAMDLLDEIAMHATPDPDKQRELAAVAYRGLRAQASRGHLTIGDALIAESLFDELGLPGVEGLRPESDTGEEAREPGQDPWDALRNKTVVLYTLLDGLGARFAERVKSFCPDAEVDVLDDHVASARLVAAVQRADFVMVDTRHAKHAATGAIDDLIPSSQQLLPEGKGASSFLRCLLERLSQLAVA